MKINTNTNTSHLYTLHRTQSSEIKSANATSFSSALSVARAASVKTEKADFYAITRKEISDWMNDQIRSGKMPLDDSTVFLGMTMKISEATGLPVDIETDKLVSHAYCVQKHLVFHHEVSKVAMAVNANRYSEAEGMLGAGTSYAKASSDLSVSFLRLRKEAGI